MGKVEMGEGELETNSAALGNRETSQSVMTGGRDRWVVTGQGRGEVEVWKEGCRAWMRARGAEEGDSGTEGEAGGGGRRRASQGVRRRAWAGARGAEEGHPGAEGKEVRKGRAKEDVTGGEGGGRKGDAAMMLMR